MGKTTLVREVERRQLEGVGCYYFDSIGVPTTQEMVAQWGSPGAWQEAMTHEWIRRLAANAEGDRIAVLDGQVRPTVVRIAFRAAGIDRGRIVLVDCDHETRDSRLRSERDQPELVSRDMAAWAAYLRGQADAMELPVVDTTHLRISDSTDALIALITGGQ